jgi:hypothetical protein
MRTRIGVDRGRDVYEDKDDDQMTTAMARW